MERRSPSHVSIRGPIRKAPRVYSDRKLTFVQERAGESGSRVSFARGRWVPQAYGVSQNAQQWRDNGCRAIEVPPKHDKHPESPVERNVGLWHDIRHLAGCLGSVLQGCRFTLYQREWPTQCSARRRPGRLRRSCWLHRDGHSRGLSPASYEESARARTVPVRETISNTLHITRRRDYQIE